MKRIILIVGVLLAAGSAWAAIPADTAWEVRATGVDTNGAGFSTASEGANGIDYSQQDSPQVTFTGTLSAVGTTALTDSGLGFLNTHQGNVINIPGQGRYCITGYTSSSIVTVDRAMGTFSTTTGYLGGGSLTINNSSSTQVAGNTIWVKNGTYSITASITSPTGATGKRIRYAGYNTTHGDLDDVTNFANFPQVVVNNVAIYAFSLGIYISVDNFIVSAGVGATKGTRGISVTSYDYVDNCKVTGFSAIGIASAGGVGVTFYRDYVSGGAGTSGFYSGGASSFEMCISSGNSCPGFYTSAGSVFINRSISVNNTDGLYSDSTYGPVVINSVFYGNSSNGINISATNSADACFFLNNIFAKNGAYGLKSAAAWNSIPENYNAFYSNTSGPILNFPQGSHDITSALTSDPFTSAGTGDFSLNSTSGGGALLKAAGSFGVFPLGATTGYLDIGAAQHQDSGGAAVTRSMTFVQ
jgi:hypothetical protein